MLNSLHRPLEFGRNCDRLEFENSSGRFLDLFCSANLTDGIEVCLNQGKSKKSVRV